MPTTRICWRCAPDCAASSAGASSRRKAAGLTPAQHQLLLAIRGHPDRRGPTVGEVADYLLLRHHSAVGLVDRAVAAKLVKRVRDPEDHRVVRLQLTAAGSKRLEALSEAHLEELGRLGRTLPTRLARAHAAPAAARHRDAGSDGPRLDVASQTARPRRPRYCRTREAVEESWPERSGAAVSVRIGASSFAMTLPSSTPHWSNESMPQMVPSTNTVCS